MVLQLITAFGYSLIESSWMVSTVLVKYFLALGAIYAFRQEKSYFKSFRSFVVEWSREFVVWLVFLGLLSLVASIEFTPVFTVFSHLVTVTYFGYLFWEF